MADWLCDTYEQRLQGMRPHYKPNRTLVSVFDNHPDVKDLLHIFTDDLETTRRHLLDILATRDRRALLDKLIALTDEARNFGFEIFADQVDSLVILLPTNMSEHTWHTVTRMLNMILSTKRT